MQTSGWLVTYMVMVILHVMWNGNIWLSLLGAIPLTVVCAMYVRSHRALNEFLPTFYGVSPMDGASLVLILTWLVYRAILSVGGL
jgi:hypothetical protein